MEGADWGAALNIGLIGAGVGLVIAVIYIIIKAGFIYLWHTIRNKPTNMNSKKN